ncbi:molybdate ABC transporter substrate-binding protein [Inquilinus sp. CAU 1745]|uniref:molybdate ABC transporter substrate-binding protein n=1 Tax=Inquilinus sp. CAU 1745 TaxID=3140369 RepID=UPI00325BA4D3
MRRLSAISFIAAIVIAALPARAEEVVVFAAASLKNAMDAAVTAWEEQGGEATISYAGSSALARQVEQGAPADIFISANVGWMDYLQERGLVDPATRSDLLGNRLVLIAPSPSDVTLEIAPGFDLAGALNGGYLAMANTEAVPAGIYGRTALTSLGVWGAVQGRIAQARDVRAALTLVSRGEAPLGVVYRTDAAADPNIWIVDTFPEDTHEPIIYPIALTKSAEGEAAHLLDFLTSEDAAPFFEAEGFDVLDTDR